MEGALGVGGDQECVWTGVRLEDPDLKAVGGNEEIYGAGRGVGMEAIARIEARSLEAVV
ncbi:MAG: hypothetical protein U0529_14365 [Thermoanaerobaculia bacterium]